MGYLYWHRLCWQPFLHVQKVNYARSSTVYSRIMLTPYSYLLFRKLCLQNSRIPNSLFIVTLITQGWTKLGAHAHSNTSILRLLQSSFQVNMGLMLSLSLRLVLCSCPHQTTRFLEAVATTRTITTLAYSTTNHKISCHKLVRCHV